MFATEIIGHRHAINYAGYYYGSWGFCSYRMNVHFDFGVM